MKYLLSCTLLCAFLSFFSCSGKNSNTATEESVAPAVVKAGEEWLLSIFQSPEMEGAYSLSFNVDSICTPRLVEFFSDAVLIYDTRSADLSEEEEDKALAEYKAKWKGIYKLKEDAIGMFGAGYDDHEYIWEVTVKPLGGLRYEVVIDYDWRGPARSIVRLVQERGRFLIDEMETEFVKPETPSFDFPPGHRCFTNSDLGGERVRIEMDIAKDGTVKGQFSVLALDGKRHRLDFSGEAYESRLKIFFAQPLPEIEKDVQWIGNRCWSIETFDDGGGAVEVLSIDFYGEDPETGEYGELKECYVSCASMGR